MMKKIFLLVVFFVLGKMWSYAQYPLQQNLGNDSTIVISKGALQSRLIPIVIADTNAANAQRIKGYPGAQLYTSTGDFYVRSSNATKWVLVSSGSSGPLNIYNSNGTLTGNRTLTGANYNLTFDGLNKFSVNTGDSVLFNTPQFNIKNLFGDLSVEGTASGGSASSSLTLKTDSDGSWTFKTGIQGFDIGDLRFYDNVNGGGNARMIIKATGKVGIGTESPDSLLTVAQGAYFQRGVRMSGLPTTPGIKALRIDANGRLSIADTSTGAGTVTSVATNNGSGITGGTITSTGTLAIDTTNVIATKASVSGGLAGKLNISDTASMLNPYLRKVDTASLSNRINQKLNISDTASMLSPYLRSNTAAATYVPQTRTLTINGTTQDLSANRTYNVGTVTSVGLTMPAAFNVANSPVTGSGTLAVTGAGLASQYIRGDGTLANFPGGGGGGGASISYYLNGSVNQGTFGGNTYYEMNKVPIFGAGTNFSINANGYIAQFITDAGDPGLLNIPAGNWNFETFFSASSGGGSPTYYVELYKYDGTTFTLIASGSTNPDAITGGTSVEAYFSTLPVPQTTLTLTDRLAVRIYVTHSGRTITLHTEDNNLCQIITTFTTGITAINSLTAQVQYLTTGTSGTDFNISSLTDTHTFNLPVASATNTGKLSSTDWSTFNNKLNISDTASMLANYLNNVNYGLSRSGKVVSVDSATLSNYYLRRKDSLTATNLLGYVTRKVLADTAAAIRSADAGGTVTSVATNNGTGITGGTITTTGTLAIDTLLISTRAWRQKGVDSLQANINLKLNIADTASMLSPYLRKADTTSMLANYVNAAGYGLSKAGQVLSADSATLSNYYLRRKDSLTATNLLGYVTRKILADTASAIRSSDAGGTVTSVATNNGTGITGGTITTTGTLAIDTLLISTRAWRQKGIDSVQGNLTSGLALKVNISDTASMLSPYLRSNVAAATYVPQARTITINGTSQDLSANRTYNVGTVTSVATNTGTGITGGTFTTSGTIAADTLLLSTRAWRQKGVDSVAALISSNISGTTNYIPKFTSSSAIGNSQLFDNGTQVAINTSSPSGFGTQRFLVVGSAAAQIARFTDGTNGDLVFDFPSSAVSRITTQFGTGGSLAFAIGTGFSEQMRLTSTGLGIGTSSPATKLDVNGSIRLSGTGYIGFGGGTNYIEGDNPNNILKFATNNSERMRLDASGNLGLGVTPSAWGTNWKAFDINTVGNIAATTGVTRIYHNAYNDNSSNIYKTSASASMYSQDGSHAWFIAPSGTAGNAITFTQAMTLNASGRLLLGTTSDDGGSRLQVNGKISAGGASESLNGLSAVNNSAGQATVYSYNYNASGYSIYSAQGINYFANNVGIGTTSPAYKLDVNNTGGSIAAARLYGNDQANVRLRLENTGGRTWELTGGLTGANNSTFTIYDVTATATRLQIDASGNLGLGVTPSAWGSGERALDFGTIGAISTDGSSVVIQSNRYTNGVNNIYKVNGYATLYSQGAGAHVWFNAPSGTAGNAISFTQAMTLFSTGNLAVGGTSDNGSRLQVTGAATFSRNDAANISVTIANAYLNQGNLINFVHNTAGSTTNGYIGHGGDNTGNFVILNNGITALSLARATGAATFSSSVTATQGFFNGFATNGTPSSAGTAQNFVEFRNTGGDFYVGQEGSGAGGFFTGSSAYASVFYSSTAQEFIIGGTRRLQIATSGAATFSSTIRSNDTNGLALGSIAGYRRIQYGSDNATSFTLLTDANGYAGLYAGAATFSSSVTATSLNINNTDGYLGTINSTGANGGYFEWRTSGTTIADIGTATQIFGSGGNDIFGINGRGARAIAFGTNNTERMRITSGGNVGIGTTSPQANLHISGGGDAGIVMNSTAGAYTSYINMYSAGGGATVIRGIGGNPFLFEVNGAERMRITSGGELLINTTTDAGAYYLQVNGSVYATAYYESSDLRKKNVLSERVGSDGINTITFKWKDGRDSLTHIGYAAQQVEKVLPDAVKTNPDGYKTINYDEVQTLKIANLEKEIAELKEMIKKLIK